MLEPWSTPIADTLAVSVLGVCKTFAGGVKALREITCSISSGELVALIGANGSGKTSLLKSIAGQVTLDSGTVRVWGKDPVLCASSLRSRLGWISQEPALDPEMTGQEHLTLFHALYGLPGKALRSRIEELAHVFGLERHLRMRVSAYSGGLRQRLHLALGLIHNPNLLCLDEPTASLDPGGRIEVWEMLSTFAKAGHTVIVATHDLTEASVHCDQVGLLDRGSMKKISHPTALIAGHGSAILQILFDDPAQDVSTLAGRLESLPGIDRVRISSQQAIIGLDRERGPEDEVFQVLHEAKIGVSSYQYRKPDLASAYFNLTGTTLEEKREKKPGKKASRNG